MRLKTKHKLHGLTLFLILFSACGDNEPGRNDEGLPSGVFLSFDDFSASWDRYLPLFDKHNAKVTFFVSGEFLQDEEKSKLRLGSLVHAGHSLGVHTVHHKRAPIEFASDPAKWLSEEVLQPLQLMEKVTNTRISSFAFPYGIVSKETINALRPHFSFIRDFQNETTTYSDLELQDTPRVIQSTSIDSIKNRSDRYFLECLDNLKNSKHQIWPITSHHIGTEEWGITPERLSWLLSEINKRGLRFYVAKDFL